MSTSPTAQLASYAARLGYTDLPAAAVTEAGTIMLDTIGAMLVGASPRYAATGRLADLASVLGGVAECTVVGQTAKTSCFNAALANGTAGYAADIEGGGVAGQHAAAVLVPTVLTMGERAHADGKTVIAALAAGYDVCARASLALSERGQRRRGFHPSALCGHFGAAAAAGRLLGLDDKQMRNALGLAASQAGGLIRLWSGDPTENSRPFVIGLAASNGVRAALLAQLGFGGPGEIFDAGEFNVYPAFSGEMHLEEVTRGLGTEFWITRHVGFKRYACCGGIHPGLDALFAIMADQAFTAEEVATVIYRVAPGSSDLGFVPLRSHSAPYMLAVGLANGRISSGDFLGDQPDAHIRELARRIVVTPDRDLAAPGGTQPTIELVLRDGRRFAARVDEPYGHRSRPLRADELEAKFLALAAEVMPELRARAILGLVRRLMELDDVAPLAELLGFSSVPVTTGETYA